MATLLPPSSPQRSAISDDGDQKGPCVATSRGKISRGGQFLYEKPSELIPLVAYSSLGKGSRGGQFPQKKNS